MKKFKAVPRYYTSNDWDYPISYAIELSQRSLEDVVDAIVMIAEKLGDEDIARKLLDSTDYHLKVVEEEEN